MVTVEIARKKDQLADAFRIRREVFVQEQKVPVKLERDEHDLGATHVLGLHAGRPVGTGRLVELPADDPAARASGKWGKVGRMAVLSEARRQGVGRAMLEMLEMLAREQHLEGVVLHAQEPVVPFYQALGYEAEGEPFEEAGIGHRFMRKRLR